MQLCGVPVEREDLGPFAVIFGAVAVVFGRALLAPDRLLASPVSDTVAQYYPWRVHLESALAEGRLPLWSAAEFGGTPFLANSQVGAFLPTDRLLFALVPGPYAVTLSMFLSVLTAGVGTYLFARRIEVSRVGSLTAGVGFCLSMAVIARVYVGHYSIVVAVGLLPVAYLCTDHALDTGRLLPAVGAGVALALCALAGQVQYPYLFALALGGYALVVLAGETEAASPESRRRDRAITVGRELCRLFVPMGLTAVSLAAVQLLPTLYFSRHSTRAAGLSLAESSIHALSPYQLTQLLTPYAFGRPGGPLLDLGNFWEFAFHPGVVPLLLAGIALSNWRAPRVRALIATAIISGVLALGGPAYALFFRLPLADSFRIPGRFTLFVAFAIAVLAGHGYDRLREAEISRRAWLPPGLVVAGAIGLPLAVVAFEGRVRATVVGDVDGLYPMLVRELLVAGGVAIVGGTAMLGVARRGEHETGHRVAALVLVALTVGPLVAYGGPLVASQPVESVYDDPSFGDEMVYDTRPTQTPNAYRSATLREPTNLLGGPDSLGGYNALRPAQSERLLTELARGDGRADEPILDAWGVTRVIGSVGSADGYERTGTTDGAAVFANTDALGEAYLVPGRDGGRVASTDAVESARSLSVSTPTPERVTVTGELTDGLVVVSRSYYPLWRATVDGEDVTPVATETGLLAVPVEAGAERVRLRYRPWPLWIGGALSLAGVLALLALVGYDRGWWRRLRR